MTQQETQSSEEEIDARIAEIAHKEHTRLTAESVETLNDIQTNLMSDSATIPLAVFTEVFKPYFDLAVSLTVEEAESLFDMWVSKVCNGTATSPVQVLDENGTPVAVVPALINTTGFCISDDNIKDLAQGIHKHGMEKISMPEMADAKLDRVLENTLITRTDTDEIGEQWLQFYEYFGLPISVEEGEFTYAIDYLRLQGLIGKDGKRLPPEEVAEKEATKDESDGDDFMDAMFGG